MGKRLDDLKSSSVITGLDALAIQVEFAGFRHEALAFLKTREHLDLGSGFLSNVT